MMNPNNNNSNNSRSPSPSPSPSGANSAEEGFFRSEDGERDPKKPEPNPETMKQEDLGPYSDDEEVAIYIPGRSREESDKIWEQYTREIRESEGFTVNVYPGGPLALYIPYPHFKKDKRLYDWSKTMATRVLKDFKDDSGKRYEFVDVDRIVVRPIGQFYLTFTGRQLDAPSDDVFETIQALVALYQDDSGSPNITCRIKPKHPHPIN